MNWTVLIIAAVVVVAFLALKRMSLVPEKVAQDHLRAGALVIDVRSPDEFAGGHVPRAINIPLGQLSQGLSSHVSDKNQLLLLHCLSGTRSGVARLQAKRLGYVNVFNLGSYGRAERIIRTATSPSLSAP